jgi:hypothetical protein
MGGLLGAGLGLLFAPQSGRKTRKLLSERLQKLADSAEDDLDDSGEEPEALEENDGPTAGADRAAKPGREADDGDAPEPKRASGSARAELERRLASARARRQSAFADEEEEPVA